MKSRIHPVNSALALIMAIILIAAPPVSLLAHDFLFCSADCHADNHQTMSPTDYDFESFLDDTAIGSGATTTPAEPVWTDSLFKDNCTTNTPQWQIKKSPTVPPKDEVEASGGTDELPSGNMHVATIFNMIAGALDAKISATPTETFVGGGLFSDPRLESKSSSVDSLIAEIDYEYTAGQCQKYEFTFYIHKTTASATSLWRECAWRCTHRSYSFVGILIATTRFPLTTCGDSVEMSGTGKKAFWNKRGHSHN